MTWTNWNAGEPNNSGGEDCAEINAPFAKWNDIPCSIPRGFVCKKYVNLLTTFCPANPYECCARQIKGWTCPICIWPEPYELLYNTVETAMSFDDAQSTCDGNDLGGSLAVVHT